MLLRKEPVEGFDKAREAMEKHFKKRYEAVLKPAQMEKLKGMLGQPFGGEIRPARRVPGGGGAPGR